MTNDRRRYDATSRRARAEGERRATRRRVVGAAHRLFVDKGYVATTIADIAEEAGVAIQSVYKAGKSKADLLHAAVDLAVAGDDEDVLLTDRPPFAAIPGGFLDVLIADAEGRTSSPSPGNPYHRVGWTVSAFGADGHLLEDYQGLVRVPTPQDVTLLLHKFSTATGTTARLTTLAVHDEQVVVGGEHVRVPVPTDGRRVLVLVRDQAEDRGHARLVVDGAPAVVSRGRAVHARGGRLPTSSAVATDGESACARPCAPRRRSCCSTSRCRTSTGSRSPRASAARARRASSSSRRAATGPTSGR